MTEAVVTPWLSDRDLALQNVRYVLNAAGRPRRGLPPAAGRLHRRARPPGARRGGRPARADRRRRARPAADRDRRRHVRPDEAPGRRRARAGRRGQAGRAATTTRRPTCSRRSDSMSDRRQVAAALRRHHRRRHGAAARSRCRCRTTSGPRAPRCSSPARWAWTRRWWCTPRRWVPTSRSSSSTARCNHLVDVPEVEVHRAGVPAARPPRRSTPPIKRGLRRPLVVVGACIGTDAHTVGHRRDPQHQGLRGGEGPGVLLARSRS